MTMNHLCYYSSNKNFLICLIIAMQRNAYNQHGFISFHSNTHPIFICSFFYCYIFILYFLNL